VPFGSAAALSRLGVGEGKVPVHLTEPEKKLRVALRARSRQLGDVLRSDQSQGTHHLMLEGAYEHWHQLLFARFLADNNLLVTADGIPVTLAECDELAADEGAADGLSLAMRYASRLLPQIFRPDDPLLLITFAPEHLQPLRKLVAELPTEIFQADDSLGWVYQFWRADEKKEVNEAGDTIDAESLPAVTQLFTEHYMVEFLLHNTLGAWWTAKVEADGRTSSIPLPYLRRKDDGSPAAGTFPGWPKTVREMRALDPCCGSGHFLVALFQLLVSMLREEEGLEVEEAVNVVIREILHGLELDARCTQLAAFNVAFAAWRIIGHPVSLPPLNIACSGLSVGASREEWLSAVGKGDLYRVEKLYDLFKKAPELGSLINPSRLGFMGQKATDLLPVIQGLLNADALANPERHELGVTAKGLAEAAQILSGSYNLVATNVPYLGRGDQGELLRSFCEGEHPNAKGDLATCFAERCLAFCAIGGTSAIVSTENWLFLTTYRKLREALLTSTEWNWVARLGEKGFESSAAAGAFVAILSLTRRTPHPEHQFFGIDVGKQKTPIEKNHALISSVIAFVKQADQQKNPDATIAFIPIDSTQLLGRYAECFQGISTGDMPRMAATFWEVSHIETPWATFHTPPAFTKLYAGREWIVNWRELEGGFESAAIRGHEAWRKPGVGIGQMRDLPATIYSGELFSNSTPVIIPRNAENLPAIWAFCSSPAFSAELRKLNPKVSVDNGYVSKVPFQLEPWQRVAAEKYPHGLPKPFSSDPTQWLFNGHPAGADQSLQVAVARLLGYRWPRQTGSEFPDCPALGPDGLEKLTDGDGIICLAPLRGEPAASDRLQQLLTAAYGKEWKPSVLDHLLAEAGYGGKTLDDWLRDGFFEQHCQLFHQRPFIWQIWDGQKRGFSALVNYHKLDHSSLTRLIFSYLGDWISDRKRDMDANKSGSDTLHLAAVRLQEVLKLILEGEAPHDIFVRWKPLEKQSLGWHPDINDGVRLNIRPFVQAGILRKTPKIKWGVDRGKNPSGAPWGEVRDNDVHLKLEEKRKAKKA